MTDSILKASIIILIWATIVVLIMCIIKIIRDNMMEKEFQKEIERHLNKIGGKKDDNKRDD